jgi:hypothetical protein
VFVGEDLSLYYDLKELSSYPTSIGLLARLADRIDHTRLCRKPASKDLETYARPLSRLDDDRLVEYKSAPAIYEMGHEEPYITLRHPLPWLSRRWPQLWYRFDLIISYLTLQLFKSLRFASS